MDQADCERARIRSSPPNVSVKLPKRDDDPLPMSVVHAATPTAAAERDTTGDAMSEPHTTADKDVAAAWQERPITLDLDLAALAGAMGQRLYDAGVSVTPAQSQHYAMSLRIVQPSTLRQLYFTTRSIFVTDPDEVPMFDRVFALVFDPTGSHQGGYDGEAMALANAPLVAG